MLIGGYKQSEGGGKKALNQGQILGPVLARGKMGYSLNNQNCKQVANRWQISH